MNLFESCIPILHRSELKRGAAKEIQLGNERFTIGQVGRDYYAFPPNCPHRGTPLVHGHTNEGGLTCPYHGWKVSPDGNVFAPGEEAARCRVSVTKLSLAFDYLWLNKNHLPIPVSPPDNYLFCGSQGFNLSAPFHVVLDNFNEGSHTPFVHRLLGSRPDQIPQIKFSWKAEPDHVFIRYVAPQRPNFLFNGPYWRTYLNWDIEWKTFFNPVRMEYLSLWRSIRTGKKTFPGNFNSYFIAPNGKDRTWLHAFVFSENTALFRAFSPLMKLLSMRMTRNQIMEDERFYPKIKDLPADFRGMHLNEFDKPLLEIRKRVHETYFGK